MDLLRLGTKLFKYHLIQIINHHSTTGTFCWSYQTSLHFFQWYVYDSLLYLCIWTQTCGRLFKTYNMALVPCTLIHTSVLRDFLGSTLGSLAQGHSRRVRGKHTTLRFQNDSSTSCATTAFLYSGFENVKI